jgi:hypothetical protein
MSFENTPSVIAQKKRFAKEALQRTTAFEAAQCVFPNDTGMALLISQQWIEDALVIEEMERLQAEQPDGFKPSRGQVLKQLWANATSAPMVKDRNEALKVIALVEGWIVPATKADGKDGAGSPPAVVYMPYPDTLPEKQDA